MDKINDTIAKLNEKKPAPFRVGFEYMLRVSLKGRAHECAWLLSCLSSHKGVVHPCE